MEWPVEEVGWPVEELGWHAEEVGWHAEEVGWHVEEVTCLEVVNYVARMDMKRSECNNFSIYCNE